MAANCKLRHYFLIVAVGTVIDKPRFSAIQPVLLRTTATAKASASLGMARSSFSASEVCQIVCGDDSDEEFIFPGSDDDLGMNDTDDDDLEGDSDSDEPSEMCKTGTGNLSGGNQSNHQYTGSTLTHVHFLLHARKFHDLLPLKQKWWLFLGTLLCSRCS